MLAASGLLLDFRPSAAWESALFDQQRQGEEKLKQVNIDYT